MQQRSFGVVALAFSSILIALYCQVAAVALILTGLVFSPSGSIHANVALVDGVLFLGLTVASYVLAYGFWTRKGWSWAVGIAYFVTLVLASVMLSVIAVDFRSTVLPLAAAILGLLALRRPMIRAELHGIEAPTSSTPAIPDDLGGAQPIR
jgi:hypothetical protein